MKIQFPSRVFAGHKRLLALVGMVMLASCATQAPELPDPKTLDKKAADYQNPFPEGTYEHFVARKDYPKTYDMFEDKGLLDQAKPEQFSIVIDVSDQRGQLLVDGVVAMDYPLSTGTKSHPTPLGTFKIIEKKANDKESNKYGKIYDAEGKLVNEDATFGVHEIPEGGRFDGADMPYWMRLTNDGVGLHVGPVKRYRVSHGCIRHRRVAIQKVYRLVNLGTPVTVQE